MSEINYEYGVVTYNTKTDEVYRQDWGISQDMADDVVANVNMLVAIFGGFPDGRTSVARRVIGGNPEEVDVLEYV